MSYNKTRWKDGDIITEKGLNNMEQGISEAHNAVDGIQNIVYIGSKKSGESVEVPETALKNARLLMIEGASSPEDNRLKPSGMSIRSGGETFLIPNTITSLEDYGHGAGEGYNNTVDFEREKYTQRCAVFEATEAAEQYYAYFDGLTFEFPISRYDEYVKAIETVKCSHSELTFSYYEVVQKEEGTISSGMLRVKLNGNDPTEEELQSFIDAQRAAGTPVTICYGLPDPIETDITAIASRIDITVTPGGVVTFDGATGTLELVIPADLYVIKAMKKTLFTGSKKSGESVEVPETALKNARLIMIEGASSPEDNRLKPSGMSIRSGGETYQIPNTISALLNYGHGAGEGYNNTVDFESGKYTQRCAVFEPMNTGNHYYTFFQGLTFDFPISRYDEYVKAIETVKCSHSELTFSYYNVQWLDDEGGATEKEEATIADGMLRVKLNGNDPTEEELQAFIDAQRAAGTPVTICYGLPDPIETDITDIASKIDIKVTPGGVVTFDGATGTLEMFVPKELARKKYANSTFAPALRGSIHGVSVVADDVSPLPHELDVKVSSKNIFPNSYTSKGTVKSNMGKIDITYNLDGSIVCNGTVTGSGLFHAVFSLNGSLVTEHDAVFSANIGDNAPSGTRIMIEAIRPDGVTSHTSNGAILKKGTSITRVYISGDEGAVYDNFVFKPQLEYGTVPTEFTPPSIDVEGVNVTVTDGENTQTAVSDADGNVEGLMSMSPSMTLTTDNAGATIECTYNRDTTEAFNSLETKLNTLIATIGG